jgi:hypothetical protein|tara:strand:- start:241 stop:450 length:210 start_codon:yes stop_codon:yes gene_type:complete
VSEGNIISFKVFLDSRGTLMTEYRKFPKDKVSAFFEEEDSILVRKILDEVEVKLDGLHDKLEREIQALN